MIDFRPPCKYQSVTKPLDIQGCLQKPHTIPVIPKRHTLLFLAFLTPFMAATLTFAADPAPTFANVSYGPDPHQLLDVYLPPGDGPFGLLVLYGTIWTPKKGVPPTALIFPHQIAGIAVQTRGMDQAVNEKAAVPISYVLSDARRALKFIQLHTQEWKLDPKRIATCGVSQATIPSFYAALTACNVDPNSSDPVEHESVKVVAIGFLSGPGSIDPKRLMEWNPGVEWGAPAWGCTTQQALQRHDELLPVIKKWSPEYLVTKDTPPMFIDNHFGLTQPPDVSLATFQTHSPLWGIGLKKYVEQFGVTCYQMYPGHPSEKYNGAWDFLIKRLLPVPE